MEKAQVKTQAELKELNAMLASLQGELDLLNSGFAEANGELSELQTTAQVMEKRLSAASKLISGLTGERTRWTNDIQNLKAGGGRLIGDCLVTSAFLSYAGAFSADYRLNMIQVNVANIAD